MTLVSHTQTLTLKVVREAAQYTPASCKLTVRGPFDLERGVRVMCDVGYLCANFSLPRPICSRLRRDLRDRRQTDRRQMRIVA